MPYKDLQKRKEYQRNYYQEHKEEIKSRSKKWRKENRERYNKNQLNNAKKYNYKYQRRYNKKRRLECLIHYGGDPPKCACCGETIIEFLTIDHNGQPLLKKYRSGDNLYGWLIKNNFPEGFRVLCLNCNHYIGHYGWCPHDKKER